MNGDYAVALQVYKDPTANTVEIATRATALISGPIASDPTPEGIKLFVFDSRKEIQVSLNRELAAKYGLTPRDVSQAFAFTPGGQRLRKYNAGDKEVDLILTMAVGRTELDGLCYYPLARTVIGGLTASTFLTLVILPYIYVLFDSLAVWARKVWRASEPAGVTAQTAEQS